MPGLAAVASRPKRSAASWNGSASGLPHIDPRTSDAVPSLRPPRSHRRRARRGGWPRGAFVQTVPRARADAHGAGQFGLRSELRHIGMGRGRPGASRPHGARHRRRLRPGPRIRPSALRGRIPHHRAVALRLPAHRHSSRGGVGRTGRCPGRTARPSRHRPNPGCRRLRRRVVGDRVRGPPSCALQRADRHRAGGLCAREVELPADGCDAGAADARDAQLGCPVLGRAPTRSGRNDRHHARDRPRPGSCRRTAGAGPCARGRTFCPSAVGASA